MSRPGAIVFYDGVCVLCQFAVKFLIRLDRDSKLHFAPVQGTTARDLRIAWDAATPPSAQTVTFVDTSAEPVTLLWRMAAVRAAIEATGQARTLAFTLRLIPLPVANVIYRAVAATRYRVFGTYDECPLPPPEVRSRFLP